MRIFFLLILFNLYVVSASNGYPKIFSKMSEPLFSSTNQFKKVAFDKKSKHLVEKYLVNVDKTILIGLKADKLNASDKDKKEYLFSLRKLQKEYDVLLKQFRKELLVNIQKSNHNAIRKILNSDFSSILLNKLYVLQPTLEYYEKYKNLGKITVLDQIIENQKNQVLISNTSERVINNEKVISSERSSPNERFSVHGKYITDHKTGLLWQRDGCASGRLNFYQAKKYAEKFSVGNLTNWRVPTRKELYEIYKQRDNIPFIYPPSSAKSKNFHFWTSERDYRLEDYAYLFRWPKDNKRAGANNCYASKNYSYVLVVHDPV
jgi:hypothetical protein